MSNMLMPGDPLTREEKKKLEYSEDANKLLKEFREVRHLNEIEKIRLDNIKNYKYNKSNPDKKPRQLLKPYDAQRYKNAGKYDIFPAYRELTQRSSFYGCMGRLIKVMENNDIPTACVRFDITSDQFIMEYNSKFMYWMHDKFGIESIVFALKHEILHIVLGHATTRCKNPHHIWQLATDAAVNMICKSDGEFVPDFCINPGYVSPDKFGDDIYTKYNVKKSDIIKTIESWSQTDDMSSEWYFNELMKHIDYDDDDVVLVFDIHEWDKHSSELGPEDLQEYVREKARSIIKKAVTYADESYNGWGNIPTECQHMIRRMVSTTVDWKTLLKQFWGRTIRGERRCTIKKINRKYPNIHPGFSRDRQANVLIAIDESGSVGDDAIELIFAEVANLARNRDVDWVSFDTTCSLDNVKKWKKGQPAPTTREKCGGTSFQAPTDLVNDPKNSGMWDGLIIVTDGQASKPGPTRVRRAWILTPGCTLDFEVPGETVISMDNDGKIEFGAWR